METLPLKIYDNTLRDGEQQAGLFFPYSTKYKLAHLSAETGIHGIDIMPCVSGQEAQLATTLISEGLEGLITAATLMNKQFIDQIKDCGIKRIAVIYPLSDRLMFLRDATVSGMVEFQGKTIDDGIPAKVIDKIRQNAIDLIVEHLDYAKNVAGLTVDFAGEDTSRADFDFLVQCIRSCAPYIDNFILCDTVGILTPEKSYVWINDLRQSTTGVAFGLHYHNDMGMALENTLQSIIAGATLITGTFCGIGERAGNVALEQMLNGLRIRFGIEIEGINYDAIAPVIDYIEKLGVRSAAPYSQAAQCHETGVHVNSLLSDPKSYDAFPHSTIDVIFGKWSGASNFRYLFEKELQNPQPKEQYEKMRSVIKQIANEQERYFTAEEVLELWKNGAFN